jgi:hypothetical protein
MEANLQALIGVIAGIGLAAACGFRVFVPLFVAAVAVRADLLEVSDGFGWIGSVPALVSFGAATLLEVGGYYVPGVDHFLDAIATPAAVVAGTLLGAAFIADFDPWLRWSLALIAGGGLAGLVQATTVAARFSSAAATAGLANPVVATGELAGASLLSVASVVLPLSVFAVAIFAVVWIGARRRAAARSELSAPSRP